MRRIQHLARLIPFHIKIFPAGRMPELVRMERKTGRATLLQLDQKAKDMKRRDVEEWVAGPVEDLFRLEPLENFFSESTPAAVKTLVANLRAAEAQQAGKQKQAEAQ